MADIEALNRRALGETSAPRLPVSKVSACSSAYLLDDYVVMRRARARRGVGPLVVARPDRGFTSRPTWLESTWPSPGCAPPRTCSQLVRTAGPPDHTAALRKIMPAVAEGEFDAGLIIHESRFTYPDHGLARWPTWGTLWETETELRCRSASSSPG